ncbi:MAG: hypothetical protein ACRD2A_14880, partial [Vicinamibacterales bacterium]
MLDEAGRALRRGALIPVRIDAVDVPLGFGQQDYTDLIDWDGDHTHAGFQELCRSMETPAPPSSTVKDALSACSSPAIAKRSRWRYPLRRFARTSSTVSRRNESKAGLKTRLYVL